MAAVQLEPARGTACVGARGTACVGARGTACVRARGTACVGARGTACVRTHGLSISVKGNLSEHTFGDMERKLGCTRKAQLKHGRTGECAREHTHTHTHTHPHINTGEVKGYLLGDQGWGLGL